jgi:hypothetical protein
MVAVSKTVDVPVFLISTTTTAVLVPFVDWLRVQLRLDVSASHDPVVPLDSDPELNVAKHS